MPRRESAIYAGAVALYATFIASASTLIGDRRVFTLFDDAMISMRYARNFAEHGALTWNYTGPAVEGYTNFLWTLWMAFVHLWHVPERWISLVISMCGAALLVLTARYVVALLRDLHASRAATILGLVATLGCYALVFWTLRGMEVGLLAGLIAVGTLHLARYAADRQGHHLTWIAVCGAGAVLTRTDAVIFIATWLGYVSLALRGAERRRAAGAVLVAVAALITHTVFRAYYYGDLLPNTYYLKLGGVPLGARLVRGTASIWFLLQAGFGIPVCVAAFAFVHGKQRALKMLLAAQVLAAVAYSVYVGGDAWEQFAIPNRYLCPALPALFVLAALGVDAIAGTPTRARSLAAALIMLAGVQLFMPFLPATIQAHPVDDLTRDVRIAITLAFAAAMLQRAGPQSWLLAPVVLLPICAEPWLGWVQHGAADARLDADRARHGIAIREATTPDATLATTPAGNIPYFADRTTIDLLGKSDPRIAHLAPRTSRFHPGHVKWDYRYSIEELKPDLIDELFTPPESWLVDEDKRALPRWGYREIAPNLYVREASPHVDVQHLVEMLRQ